MPDYEKMYSALFNRITDAIATLQEAQQISEDIYITGDELRVVESSRPEAHYLNQ